MSDYELLTLYAMTVAKMRDLQKAGLLLPDTIGWSNLQHAEKEVDELTSLHLLPQLPMPDAWTEGGAK